MVEKALFEKLMYNLISNSFKFSPENGVISIDLSKREITKRMGLFFRKKSKQIIITILDQGPGVSSLIKENLYDPFVSMDTKNGFGLGLSIVKEIVMLHKGMITIKNTGSGALVELMLPEKQ